MAEGRRHRVQVAGRGLDEQPGRSPAASSEELRGDIELLHSQQGSERNAVRNELEECRQEADQLRGQLANVERDHRQVCDDYRALEAQIAELSGLYVVMERIHGTLDHGEVLAAIQDLVINIIGSEELAVFEPAADGRELHPVQCFGVEARHLGPVPLGAGPVGRAAAEGWSWVVGDGPPPPEYPDLTACVPLQVAGQLAGVLVIWRMLGHKAVFGPADRKALDLLSSHAATALVLTARRGQGRAQAANA